MKQWIIRRAEQTGPGGSIWLTIAVVLGWVDG